MYSGECSGRMHPTFLARRGQVKSVRGGRGIKKRLGKLFHPNKPELLFKRSRGANHKTQGEIRKIIKYIYIYKKT